LLPAIARLAWLARRSFVARMSTIILRGGVEVENPLELALELLAAYSSYEAYDPSGPASLDERDLRMTNRGGARISAAEIAAIRERRGKIERALHEIRPDASLTDATNAIPWMDPADAAFRRVRRHTRSRLFEDDESAAQETAGADPDARHRRSGVPDDG
jgi:hypothetical protein